MGRLRTRCLRWAWCPTRYSKRKHYTTHVRQMIKHIIWSFAHIEKQLASLTVYLLGWCLSWPPDYSSVRGWLATAEKYHVRRLCVDSLRKKTSSLLRCCPWLWFDLLSHSHYLSLSSFTPTIQMCVYDQENFQGRCIEITGESLNVCDMGMDKVRSLRVECGP